MHDVAILCKSACGTYPCREIARELQVNLLGYDYSGEEQMFS